MFAHLTAALVGLLAAPAAQLDSSFGGTGWVQQGQLPDGTLLQGATDVATQPDGKILVTAENTGPLGERGWLVLRFLPGGGLDPAFGQGGAAAIGRGDDAPATGLALQPDGRIVVAGPATCAQLEACFAAARLSPDGSLDATFGTGGVARVGPVRSFARDVAIQPDGRIVLAGRWYKGGDANDDDVACVMRLLPDGRLDPSFSGDGVVRMDHGHGDDFLTAVTTQRRRIVVAGAGRLITGSRGGFAVVRLRPDGSRDRTFGRRGRRIVSFRGRWATPLAVASAPGGRIVVGGNAGRGAEAWQPAVARLTRRGALDRRFGARGRALARMGPSGGGAETLAVDAHGRVIVAGDAFADAARGASDWAFAGLTPAGRSDGVLRSDFTPVAERVTALAIAGDRLVAAGAIGSSLGVARYVLR